MDNEYLKKVVEEEYEEGLTELQNKVKVYKRLGEELVGEERFYLKIIEHEIKDLEETDGDFTDYLIRKGLEYDRQREELSEYDEENLGCQSGDDDGKELTARYFDLIKSMKNEKRHEGPGGYVYVTGTINGAKVITQYDSFGYPPYMALCINVKDIKKFNLGVDPFVVTPW